MVPRVRLKNRWPKNKTKKDERNWHKHDFPVKMTNFRPKKCPKLVKKGPKLPKQESSRTKSTVKWFKVIVYRFWPSFIKFWCTVLKKMAKNLILGQKWPIFGPKKGPKQAKFFFQNFKFLYPLIIHKYCSNNKTWP